MSASLQTACPSYLTIQEAAGILRRRTWDVLSAIEARELRACQPGGEGAWLIHPDDLTAWVTAWENTPADTLSERLATARA